MRATFISYSRVAWMRLSSRRVRRRQSSSAPGSFRVPRALGEMALLYNSQRTATASATASATVESHVLYLSRAAYQLTLIEGSGGGGGSSGASSGKSGRAGRLDAYRRHGAHWISACRRYGA